MYILLHHFCVRKSFGPEFEWYWKFADNFKEMVVFVFSLFNLLLRWVREKNDKCDLLLPSVFIMFLDEF